MPETTTNQVSDSGICRNGAIQTLNKLAGWRQTMPPRSCPYLAGLAPVGEPHQRSPINAEQLLQQVVLKIYIASTLAVPLTQENPIVDTKTL